MFIRKTTHRPESMPVDEYAPCSQENRKNLKYTIIQNNEIAQTMVSVTLNLEILNQWCIFVYTDKYMAIAGSVIKY